MQLKLRRMVLTKLPRCSSCKEVPRILTMLHPHEEVVIIDWSHRRTAQAMQEPMYHTPAITIEVQEVTSTIRYQRQRIRQVRRLSSNKIAHLGSNPAVEQPRILSKYRMLGFTMRQRLEWWGRKLDLRLPSMKILISKDMP